MKWKCIFLILRMLNILLNYLPIIKNDFWLFDTNAIRNDNITIARS